MQRAFESWEVTAVIGELTVVCTVRGLLSNLNSSFLVYSKVGAMQRPEAPADNRRESSRSQSRGSILLSLRGLGEKS